MHILRIMNNPSNTMKKREKMQSKGQQQEKNIQARHTWNGHRAEQKRAESERGSAAPKGQTLEREVHVHS